MNNKNLACGFMFTLGVGIGSVTTWIFAKKKYEAIIEKETESVRKQYNYMAQKLAEKNRVEKEALTDAIAANSEQPKIDIPAQKDSYQEIVEEISEEVTNTFEQETDVDISDEIYLEPADPEEPDDIEEPYLIEEDEYGTVVGYDYESLTYYKNDNVVTDSNEQPIDNYESLIGADALNKFGYIKEDPYVVYVRNDNMQCDYEILLNESNYTK